MSIRLHRVWTIGRGSVWFALMILFVGCSTEIKPVPIQPEDMCSFCRMAISQKQFAAEIIGKSSEIFKFDDIGCMVNFIEKRNYQKKIAASYVMDFEKRTWIPADDAYYVATRQVPTPMNGGFLAFQTREAAELSASRNQGRMLLYEELKKQEGQP